MCLEMATTGYEMDIDCYKKIFMILYEEHNKYCNKWLANTYKQFNLKKKCICDIYNLNKGVQKDFKEYLDSYLKNLLDLYFEILERIDKECSIFIRGRIKSQDSIIDKINKKSKYDEGKFPINKCLNDLLGFRIIDSKYNYNIDNVKKCLEDFKKDKYKIKNIDRINGNYKGYHVYFMGEKNSFFPIELQIWNSENEQQNLDSHRIYKQHYIKRISAYKNF